MWLARDALGKHRAVKLVRPRISEMERSFRREFEGLQRFEPISREHDSQVDIVHVGRLAGGGYFYAMESADDVVSGQQIDPARYQPRTLHSELQRRGRLPILEGIQVGIALTRALEHLHGHGLVHRDVKPGNVIFVNGVPKLADIGLVATSEATVSRAGTDFYLPDTGAGKPSADLFSLGKTLYETSSGRRVEDYPELPADFDQMPEREALFELMAVVAKACEPEPRQRPAAARDMQKEPHVLQAGESVRRVRRRDQLLRLGAFTGAAAVVLGLAVLTFLFLSLRAKRQTAAVAELQLLRRQERPAGRFTNVWALTGRAANLLPIMDGRSHSAAALIGRDATKLYHFTNYGAASVAFSPGGDTLLMSSLTGGVRRLELATGKRTTNAVPGNGPGVYGPDGIPIQLTLVDGRAYELWEVEAGRKVAEFPLPSLKVWDVLPESVAPVAAMTPAAEVVAVGCRAGEMRGRVAVWRVAPPSRLVEFACTVTALALSLDGRLLAMADSGGNMRVVELTQGSVIATYAQGHVPVRSLAFGRDPVVRQTAASAAGN